MSPIAVYKTEYYIFEHKINFALARVEHLQIRSFFKQWKVIQNGIRNLDQIMCP